MMMALLPGLRRRMTVTGPLVTRDVTTAAMMAPDGKAMVMTPAERAPHLQMRTAGAYHAAGSVLEVVGFVVADYYSLAESDAEVKVAVVETYIG